MKANKKKLLLKYFIKSRQFKRALQKKFSQLALPDYTSFSILSVIIGIAAGFSAVLFHKSIELLNILFFGQSAEGFYFLGATSVILLPALGMFIQGIMILLAPDVAKKKGVTEVIKAVTLRGGYIPLRTTIFNFIAPVICIGSGGTLGPEGPAAQLGGGVASKLSNLFGLSDVRIRIFTAAGTGAAIAAIFNTPLGGVFFALEIVLLSDFHAPTLAALILATVAASAVSRIILGNESVFLFSIENSIDFSNLYLYAILGLIAGAVSLFFIKYSNRIQYLFRKKILTGSVPQWLIMTFVGLVIGVCGFFFKGIFGIGYDAINEILSNKLAWYTVIVLIGLKFILVPITLHSGGFGGLFAPSLFIGAGTGYIFTYVINSIWNLNLDPTTMILVGMGAVLGGINTIPISAILIIFEMTQNYSFILPLMLAVIISTMLVQIALGGSVHSRHLESEGYRITEGREVNLLKSILVSEVELEKIITISEVSTLPQLMAKLIETPGNSLFTVDTSNKITGVITLEELRPIITEYENIKEVLIARDLTNPEFTIVKTRDDLDFVFNLFGKFNLDQLPVYAPEDDNKILGVITRQKVISVYNEESLKIDIKSGLAKELKTLNFAEASEIADGYSIIEYQAVPNIIGKSLKELRLRNKFGVEVLMIKKRKDFYSDKTDPIIYTPDPEYKIKETDTLVLFGSNENLNRLKVGDAESRHI